MSVITRLRPRRRGRRPHSPSGARRRVASAQGRLAAVALIAAGAAALTPATASAEVPTTGILFADATDLGKVNVGWNLLGANGYSTKLFLGDTVVATEVDETPGVGAGVGAGRADVTIPDEQLYGDAPITIHLEVYDAAGNEIATSPIRSVGPCPNVPPRAKSPVSPSVSAVGSTTARVEWRVAPDVCHAKSTAVVIAAGDQSVTVPAGTSSTTITGLTPGTHYDATLTSLPSSTTQPETPAKVAFTTDPGTDTTPPTKPGPVDVRRIPDSFFGFTVSWGASTDNVGIAGYDVYEGATLVREVPGLMTSVPITPSQSRAASVTVVARDAAGNVSAPSDPATFNSCTFGPPAAAPPVDVAATDLTSTGATISWRDSASGSCFAQPASRFTVYAAAGVNETPVPVGSTSSSSGTGPPATSLVVTGLQAGQMYQVYVEATAGSWLAKSQTIEFTTLPPEPVDQPIGFGVRGVATLKNLIKGSLPLVGTANGTLTPAGKLTADLQLASSTASLKALGFLPVTATVVLAPTTPLTGTLSDTTLAASVKTRVKIPSVKLFGLTLGGGANCQAAQISAIPLTSTAGFTGLGGGTLAGTFSIGNLAGCGALTGIVSPLTSGTGNAIALTLAPASPPAS